MQFIYFWLGVFRRVFLFLCSRGGFASLRFLLLAALWPAAAGGRRRADVVVCVAKGLSILCAEEPDIYL